MIDDEFRLWRHHIGDAVKAGELNLNTLLDAMGEDEARILDARVDGELSAQKVIRAVEAMGAAGLNMNEAVMAAATYITELTRNAPEDLLSEVRTKMAAKFRGVLRNLMMPNEH